MNLHRLYITKNECYIRATPIKPVGVMVHSTSVDNAWLKRYVGPDDGKLGVNKNNNHWNHYHGGGKDIGPHAFKADSSGKCAYCGGRQVCVHAFIGKLKDGTIATYQTLPWTVQGWHAGGSANKKGYIGFEICEDDLTHRDYFDKVYQEAVELTAYLCKTYSLDPLKDGVVICHSEGHKRGIASNHADVMHWFPKHGKSMDTFRNDVKKAMDKEEKELTEQQIRTIIKDEWAKLGDDMRDLVRSVTRDEMNKAEQERAAQQVPKWAAESGEYDAAIADGITDGTRPMAYSTRLETAIMIERAKADK